MPTLHSLPVQPLAGLSDADVDAMPVAIGIEGAEDLEDQIKAESWSGIIIGPGGNHWVYVDGTYRGWRYTLAEAERYREKLEAMP